MIKLDEKKVGKIKVMNGNMAAAYGAKLCRPEIISAYPITPQTPLVEYLAKFVADNELDATMVEVEGEHSAMSVLQGAAISGSRTFTGTSAQGLAFMYEAYFRSSTLRLPMVMVVATREMNSPQTVWSGQQDILTLRDAGWIQLFVENNQEILDTVVMAYKIAEHDEVLLPVNVCYDGFYLSHLSEGVLLPPQDLVDSFLPPYSPSHLYIDPERPIAIDPLTLGGLMMEFRSKHCAAMKRARAIIRDVGREFGEIFGRHYDNLIEQFQMDDAELVLITMGSVTGTARVAVNRAREAGKKIGLIKIRTFRPFPMDDLKKVLAGRKAVGVIDRSVCFGWNAGITFVEVKAALNGNVPNPPLVNFIGGLGGSDIRVDHIGAAIEIIDKTAQGFVPQEVTWL